MSVQIMSWVLENSNSKLGTRLVALAMANYANKDTRRCYSSVKTIAEDARLSERQAQRCIRELVKIGELRPAGKYKLAENIITNVYEFTLVQGGVTKCHPVTFDVDRGDKCDTLGVTPMSPKPEEENRNTKPEEAAKPPVPPKVVSIKQSKAAKPLPEKDQKFLDLWRAAYKEDRGISYRVGGLSYTERAALGRLMESTEKTPEDLVLIARTAWKFTNIFECKTSLSITGFEAKFYEIEAKVSEIRKGKIKGAILPQTQPPPPVSTAPEPERMDWDEFKALSVDEKIRLVGGLKLKNGEWLMPYEDWKLPLKSAV